MHAPKNHIPQVQARLEQGIYGNVNRKYCRSERNTPIPVVEFLLTTVRLIQLDDSSGSATLVTDTGKS